MKYLNWKIGIALLTFIIGTILVLAWLAFERVESPLDEPKPITSTDLDYLRGRSDAERDVRSGKLIIIVEGQTRFEVILREELAKCGVQIQSIGCFFNKQAVQHGKGYNEISEAAIDALCGKGVAEEAIRKAAEQDFDATP
ncbi:MAG: hypothetical protein QOC96_2015 [Acidobacteriota bacterium]|jgi:hypothetical protein|nr:hypothetical protein [Acidobacteriota bacterium]